MGPYMYVQDSRLSKYYFCLELICHMFTLIILFKKKKKFKTWEDEIEEKPSEQQLLVETLLSEGTEEPVFEYKCVSQADNRYPNMYG